MSVIPVLFDTDIGTNIDDALALAYLLRQPRCSLLGITTVSGETHRRAACAAAVCRAAGRDDVPIHAGESLPLLFGQPQHEVPHYRSLSPAQRAAFDTSVGAVEFLRKTIRSSAQPIVLLTTGPLTNVARLFISDPHAAGMLGGLVSMAGVFGPHERSVETNCRIDPVAAAIVFEHWMRSHFCRTHPGPASVSVGLDVTTRCTMSAADVRRLLATRPPLDAVAAMAGEWLNQRNRITFNDPLAAAIIFRPQCVGCVRGDVTVDTARDAPTAGATRLREHPNGLHDVAMSVEPDTFFSEFFSVL